MDSDTNCAPQQPDICTLRRGLKRIRRRRWLLWSLLIVYLPAMAAAQKITGSFEAALPAFFVWFVLLLALMGFSALARCPRCGNYFHVQGMVLLYLRSCLHCQLHLTEDKKSPGGSDCVRVPSPGGGGPGRWNSAGTASPPSLPPTGEGVSDESLLALRVRHGSSSSQGGSQCGLSPPPGPLPQGEGRVAEAEFGKDEAQRRSGQSGESGSG